MEYLTTQAGRSSSPVMLFLGHPVLVRHGWITLSTLTKLPLKMRLINWLSSWAWRMIDQPKGCVFRNGVFHNAIFNNCCAFNFNHLVEKVREVNLCNPHAGPKPTEYVPAPSSWGEFVSL